MPTVHQTPYCSTFFFNDELNLSDFNIFSLIGRYFIPSLLHCLHPSFARYHVKQWRRGMGLNGAWEDPRKHILKQI